MNLQEYFRDVHDHLARLQQSIDNLRDMVSTAISVNLSLINLQENEVVKRLAAYASLVAVPTLIAGIYGMNFDFMPELRMSYGYPLALSSMVVVDLYLAYRFKKAHGSRASQVRQCCRNRLQSVAVDPLDDFGPFRIDGARIPRTEDAARNRRH